MKAKPRPDFAHGAGTILKASAYHPTRGAGALPQDQTHRAATGGESMRIELYRVIHWVAIGALVVWTVYSAYSAIAFS
jgi:hypothetical protein